MVKRLLACVIALTLAPWAMAVAKEPVGAKKDASKPAAAAASAAQRYGFNDPNGRDTVAFVLDAPLETINGLSNSVTGHIRVDGGGKATGELRVPVSSIKTGNETRDGHLQNDRWLDAAKHPDIIALFDGITLPELEDGKPQRVDSKVRLTVRGVTREVPVQVLITRMKESEMTRKRAAGDLLRVRAKFQVPLAEFGILRDGPLLLKVAEVADVNVDAWGSTTFGP